MIDEQEAKLREQIVEVMAAMDARGLNRGTSGNVSARLGEGALVTPTGIPPSALKPEHIVKLSADGSYDLTVRASGSGTGAYDLLLIDLHLREVGVIGEISG